MLTILLSVDLPANLKLRWCVIASATHMSINTKANRAKHLCANHETPLQVSPADRITLDQVGSSEWLRGQRFPESYPKYSIFPSLDSAAPVSEEDLEARTHLEDLGISEDMMRDCVDKGARNHITGAYRIMLHKIQTAPPPQDNIDSESAGTATGTPSPGGKPDRISNKVERLFSVKNRKSRTCVLL